MAMSDKVVRHDIRNQVRDRELGKSAMRQFLAVASCAGLAWLESEVYADVIRVGRKSKPVMGVADLGTAAESDVHSRHISPWYGSFRTQYRLCPDMKTAWHMQALFAWPIC